MISRLAPALVPGMRLGNETAIGKTLIWAKGKPYIGIRETLKWYVRERMIQICAFDVDGFL
jgi:hypothetical protein